MPLTDAEGLARIQEEYENPEVLLYQKVELPGYALEQNPLCYPYPEAQDLEEGEEQTRIDMVKLVDLTLEVEQRCVFHHGILPGSDPQKVFWGVTVHTTQT